MNTNLTSWFGTSILEYCVGKEIWNLNLAQQFRTSILHFDFISKFGTSIWDLIALTPSWQTYFETSWVWQPKFKLQFGKPFWDFNSESQFIISLWHLYKSTNLLWNFGLINKFETSIWQANLGPHFKHLKLANLFWDFDLKANLKPQLAKSICDFVFTPQTSKPIFILGL